MLASIVVDSGFEPQFGETKEQIWYLLLFQLNIKERHVFLQTVVSVN
jgi:hypothetical protein